MRTLSKNEFPALLQEIPDAPEKLYQKGTMPGTNSKLLCVVGSRQYTPYGREVCETLIAGLSGYDVVIVSGLAIGIDGIAHRAALKAGLGTIAVPGSGLNAGVLYPRSHVQLAKEILDSGGVLLSEFDPDDKATPFNFPRRNRLMAGLSHATLVIEAALKSGTLITARLATDYNRDVMVAPGSLFSKSSAGSHMLIRLGATLVRDADDILDTLDIKKESRVSALPTDITEREKQVLLLLQSPLPKDKLMVLLSLSTVEANVLITSMELKGLVTERYGELHAVYIY